MNNLRARFWVEAVLGSITLALLVLTLAWKDWIEVLFGVDPDHHNGAVEWAIVAVCAVATVACGSLAGSEFHRARMHAYRATPQS